MSDLVYGCSPEILIWQKHVIVYASSTTLKTFFFAFDSIPALYCIIICKQVSQYKLQTFSFHRPFFSFILEVNFLLKKFNLIIIIQHFYYLFFLVLFFFFIMTFMYADILVQRCNDFCYQEMVVGVTFFSSSSSSIILCFRLNKKKKKKKKVFSYSI